jgi:hypothetical protein
MLGGDAILPGLARQAPPEPAVFCPFPPLISPYVAEVQRHAVEWAARYRFLVGAAARSGFARARFAHLMARAYPAASPCDLCLAVTWLTVTFVLDDHFETALGRAPGRQRSVGAAILAHLRAGGTREESRRAGEASRREAAGGLCDVLGHPFAGALADAWSGVVARTDRRWRDGFLRHVEEYLAANAWEADNRVRGRIPRVGEYVAMRRHSAATAMFFDFIEVFGGAPMPAAVAADPGVRAMRRHAGDAIAWFNDLVSWRKERAAGDTHNLVLVLHSRHGIPVPDAVGLVVARHDRAVRRFLALRERLCGASDSRATASAAVGALADGLAHWIRANVDWSLESGRYQ